MNTTAVTQTQPSTLLSGPRAVAARRPLALFLVLVFGSAYPLMALVILAQHGVIPGANLPALLGLDMERAASTLMLFGGLLPAALVVTALEGGSPALRALARRVFRWRMGLGWWLIAAAALPAATILLAWLMGDSLRMPSAGDLAGELVAGAIGFLLINVPEEAGWAGFLQTRLERRHGFLLAAALTALPFGAIHMPLQLINGNTTPGGLALAFALYLILGLVVRPLFGMALRGSGDSVLAAALLHTSFNRSNNIDGIAADVLAGPHRQLAALIATVLVTVVLGLSIRRKLTRAYRQELDARNGEEVTPIGSLPR